MITKNTHTTREGLNDYTTRVCAAAVSIAISFFILLLCMSSGKSHHATTRNRDRVDSQSGAEGTHGGGEASSIPGSSTAGNSINTGAGTSGAGSGVVSGSMHSYGSSLGWGGGGGGGWMRNFVGSASAAAQAGYGIGLTAGLEPEMSGDKRALWACFCSFKTKRER